MSQTLFFDFLNGTVEQSFPCRCGKTHRGPYAAHEYGHHNCFHDAPLKRLAPDTSDLICPRCGKTFVVGASSTGMLE